MITQSDRDREIYESRLKMRRDITTALAEAEEKGEARGRVEVQIRRIQSLQRLLRQAIGSSEELGTRSLLDLESLACQLEDQLDAKLGNGSFAPQTE